MLLDELLANQEVYLSGERLSQKLNISRTAVWKFIKELENEGYIIEGVRKLGYRLSHIPDIMTPSAILTELQTQRLGQNIVYFDTVDSTQRIAHQLAREGKGHGTVVVADEQTGGKGRLGREWFSPSGTGIWISMIIRPELPLHAVPQLTLLSAVAITKGIRELTELDVKIKWPNDLLLHGKKICGILTELNAEADRVNYVIIGFGLNVNHSERDFPDDLRQIATSLAMEKGTQLERAKLIARILENWEKLYQHYCEHGFELIKTLWETYAISIGKQIVARTLNGSFQGEAVGITHEGVLLLKDENGQVHKIYSADIDPV